MYCINVQIIYILRTLINGKYIKDTVTVIEGSFQFKGQIKQPSFAHLLFSF